MSLFSSLFQRKSISTSASVCLLIDYENFAISLRNKSESSSIDIDPILRVAEELNHGETIAVARAYADWRHFGRYADDLVRLGIQTVQAPNHRLQGKNATDIQMAVEATDLLHLRQDLHHFILVTGDSDFNPLVHLLRSRGRQVTGIGIRGTVSPYFEKVCDQFLYYDSLTDAVSAVPKAVSKPLPSRSQAPSHGNGQPVNTQRLASIPLKREMAVPIAKVAPVPSNGSHNEREKLDTLGLDPEFRIETDRMKSLIPLLLEVVREARPGHVSEMKKALTGRFSGKITPHEAATLANLFKRVNGYGSGEGVNWLNGIGSHSDDVLDILLATAADVVSTGGHGMRGEEIATLLFGATPGNPSEMNMRQTRGRKLYDEMKRRRVS